MIVIEMKPNVSIWWEICASGCVFTKLVILTLVVRMQYRSFDDNNSKWQNDWQAIQPNLYNSNGAVGEWVSVCLCENEKELIQNGSMLAKIVADKSVWMEREKAIWYSMLINFMSLLVTYECDSNGSLVSPHNSYRHSVSPLLGHIKPIKPIKHPHKCIYTRHTNVFPAIVIPMTLTRHASHTKEQVKNCYLYVLWILFSSYQPNGMSVPV